MLESDGRSACPRRPLSTETCSSVFETANRKGGPIFTGYCTVQHANAPDGFLSVSCLSKSILTEAGYGTIRKDGAMCHVPGPGSSICEANLIIRCCRMSAGLQLLLG